MSEGLTHSAPDLRVGSFLASSSRLLSVTEVLRGQKAVRLGLTQEVTGPWIREGFEQKKYAEKYNVQSKLTMKMSC